MLEIFKCGGLRYTNIIHVDLTKRSLSGITERNKLGSVLNVCYDYYYYSAIKHFLTMIHVFFNSQRTYFLDQKHFI